MRYICYIKSEFVVLSIIDYRCLRMCERGDSGRDVVYKLSNG
jgi:hypothetical protein